MGESCDPFTHLNSVITASPENTERKMKAHRMAGLFYFYYVFTKNSNVIVNMVDIYNLS